MNRMILSVDIIMEKGINTYYSYGTLQKKTLHFTCEHSQMIHKHSQMVQEHSRMVHEHIFN